MATRGRGGVRPGFVQGAARPPGRAPPTPARGRGTPWSQCSPTPSGDPMITTHPTRRPDRPARMLIAGLLLGAALALPSLASAQGSCGSFASGAVIGNGVIQLGVNCQGHLNFPFSPDPLGIGFMGL